MIATYDLIDAAGHSGWEKNKGAYGEAPFNVTERVARLGMDVLYIETSHHYP